MRSSPSITTLDGTLNDANARIMTELEPKQQPELSHSAVALPTLGVEPPASPPTLSDQTNYLPPRQIIIVLVGLSTALACAFLEQTILATALPTITSDLNAGKLGSWVATSYLLTSLAFTPLYGRWSDIFGRKPILIGSLSIFFVFSVACALAQTMLQLITFRALQGIGGGGLITMVLIIISDVVPLQERGKYQGIIEIVGVLSNGIGPILGGVFSQYTSWRWAFWINLPLSALAIVVSIWILPLKTVDGNVKEKLLRIDYIGSGLTILGSVGILLGFSWGGVTYSWTSPAVLVPLLLGIFIFILFFAWEATCANVPIIPVHIFKYKTVVGVYIATAMFNGTFFCVIYYLPQFLQLVRGISPLSSSLLLLSFLMPIAFFVTLSGFITARTGHYKYLVVGGLASWSMAQGLMTTIDQNSSVPRISGFLFMGGASSGFVFQTSLLAAQAAVPRHEVAVVTGVRNFVRLLGATLVLAIAGSAVNNILRSVLKEISLSSHQTTSILDNPAIIFTDEFRQFLTIEACDKIIAGYTRGFQVVFYITTACQLVALLSTMFLVGQHELTRPTECATGVCEKQDIESSVAKNEASSPCENSVYKA